MKFIERHAWNGEGGVRKLFVPREKAIDIKNRTISFVVSTAAKDRDGDMVDPKGWKLDKYRGNPVVLWAHRADQPPVGKALTIGIEGNALKSTAQFATREEYAFADTVFQLYAGGYLNAVSAGFMPTDAEVVEDAETGAFGFEFKEQELWEFSAVPVPSNPEALVAARSAKIDVSPAEEWIEQHLDDPAFRKHSPAAQILSGAYIALKGSVHPGVSDDILAKNKAALAAKKKMPEPEDEEVVEEVVEEEKRETFTTTGGEGHEHEFTFGEDMTEEAGDPPHVHGVMYDDDGKAIIGEADGHTHEAPDGAVVDMDDDEAPDEDQDEQKAAPVVETPEPVSAAEVEPVTEAKEAPKTSEPEVKAATPDPERIRRMARKAAHIAVRKAITASVPVAVEKAIRALRGRLD